VKGFITHQTIFKKNSILPSSQVPDTHKLNVKTGEVFEVLAYREAGGNHWTVTFAQNLGSQRWNTWCVFKSHIEFEQPIVADLDIDTHISETGLSLIKRYEGFRANAYLCPAGVWTIGYGSTHGVLRGQWISEPEAAQRLRKEVQRYEKGVLDCLKVPASQNQFDALTSLAYNIGTGAIARSSVVKFHNQRDFARAADAFLLWNKGGGRVLPGLTRRRQEERSLYLK